MQKTEGNIIIMENYYFLSREELSSLLENKFNPIDINDIISAYEMADQAYGEKKNLSGQPYFFHTSRVVKILLSELDVRDSDLIIATLLHDLYKTSGDISDEIINYNFNPYVTYLVNALKEDIEFINKNPFNSDERIKLPFDDYLIIWMAEHLDNLRYPAITPELNPLNYILNITTYFFPLSKKSKNEKIKYLYLELKKERIKILS